MRLCGWVLVGAVALGGSGCAGYRVGPVNGMAAGSRSVQVNPFTNKTLEPRLTDAVTQQLRKQLQLDGTYRLASHNDGDIIVSGSIVNYTRTVVSYSSSDVLTVQDYELEITAQVSARDRSGRTILEQPVKGTTLIRVQNDLTSSERQGLPLLATSLAKNVTALLSEGGW